MSQTQQKEKVRITIKDTEITDKEELKVLLESNPEIWTPSDGNTEFENAFFKEFKKLAPAFCYILDTEILKPENKDKQLSFFFKDYMYGINKKSGLEFLWRRKNAGGGSVGGGNYNKQTFPLAELFFGTVDECNEKLKDESKKWYYVDQSIMTSPEDGHTVLAFMTLKRNRAPT